MRIDKTTGKGCAWSIASKTVAKKLVAERIVEKTILSIRRGNAFTVLRVVERTEGAAYVIRQRGEKTPEEPLWFPSFIDIKTWKQAVSKFKAYERLDKNVEDFLLPEMEEYLHSIPDTELVSMTREFLIAHGVINTPIRQRLGKTYYFNENEVFTLDKEQKLFPYEKHLRFNLFRILGETCFNLNVWHKAVSQFEVGMTLDECIRIFLKTESVHRVLQEQPPIDRLVQSIASPIYERNPENKNESTFDRVRIVVGLCRYQFTSWEALRDEVEKHRDEIYQRVVSKLENDRQFKKYGVPINFFRLSDAILLRNFSMEFIFELKNQSKSGDI